MNEYRLYKEGLPHWKKAPCLGCQKSVNASRDAHVLFAGRRDGSSLICIGLDSITALSHNVDAFVGADDCFLLGIAHRGCVNKAMKRLQAREVVFPSSLPVVQSEYIDDEPMSFHLPPPTNSCPFCGATSNLSKEDIWPKWLERKYLELADKKAEERLFKTTSHGKVQTHRRIGITAPCCKTCNNIWLSVIENDVKPILLPMIIGDQHQAELNKEDQQLLATWAVKVALMVEISPAFRKDVDTLNPPIIPTWLYRDLRWRRTPSPNTAVFLGAYLGHPGSIMCGSRDLHIGIPKTSKPNGFATLFTTGRVLFQVISFFGKGTASLSYPENNGLHRIWPTESMVIQWPRDNLAYSDKVFEILLDKISDK